MATILLFFRQVVRVNDHTHSIDLLFDNKASALEDTTKRERKETSLLEEMNLHK